MAILLEEGVETLFLEGLLRFLAVVRIYGERMMQVSILALDFARIAQSPAASSKTVSRRRLRQGMPSASA